MLTIEELKKVAAARAVEHVESGMVLGLGSGSTANEATLKIGELWQAGTLTDIVGVATSESTMALAQKYDLPLAQLYEQPKIDLAIDGADEVDPHLNLIKGLGGALLREKMVESAAISLIIIVDGRKTVEKLGTRGPLPVEVTQFGWQVQAEWLATLGCTPTLRVAQTQPFITDNHNYILDCAFPQGIDDPSALALTLKNRVGVVEHGLFLGMATEVIVATADGIRVLS